LGRILAPIQDRRGFGNEDLVERILKKLKEEGLIRHFFRTEHGSRLDRHGIDFEVVKNDSSHVIIDVKSSRCQVDEFNKKKELFKDNRRYDGVFAVLVKSDYLVDDQPLKEELRRILGIE